MKTWTKIRRWFFPNASMNYEEIKATYDIPSGETHDSSSDARQDPFNPQQFRAKVQETVERNSQAWQEQFEAERANKLNHISACLETFAQGLEAEIMRDAEGKKSKAIVTGRVTHEIQSLNGTPELFMRGNEFEVQQVPGYKVLEDKCRALGYRLYLQRVDDGTAEKYDALRRDLGISSLAPSLYHVNAVVSGWDKRNNTED